MDEKPREIHPTRRPLLLIVIGLVLGAMLWRHDLEWLALAGIPLLLLLWFGGRARSFGATLTLCLAIVAGLLFVDWRNTPDADALLHRIPERQEVAHLVGIVVEGSSGSSLDPLAFESEEFGASTESQLPSVFQPLDERPASFLFEVRQLDHTPASGRVRVYVNGVFPCGAGEELRFWGSIERPRRASNPGEADMRSIWELRRVFHAVRVKNAAQIERVNDTWEFPLTQASEEVRAWVVVALKDRLTPPSLALFRCMVLGERNALSPQVRRAFVETGSVHILVVSGLHVMILCLGATFLCRLARVNLRIRLALSSLIAIAFLVVTGGQIATLRAVSMVLLFNIAQWRGRHVDVVNLLVTSALIVFVRDPNDVLGWGFWLSYLAVFGLSLGFSTLRRSNEEEELDAPTPSVHALRFVGKSFASSAFALLATLPLTLKGWHILSPVGVFVNLLVIVPVYAVLALALLMPLLVVPLLGDIVVIGLEVSLEALWRIISLSRSVESSHFWSYAPSWGWIVAYFAGVLGFFLVRGRPALRPYSMIACILVLAWLPWSFPSPSSTQSLSVLDVRQGSSAVFEDGKGGVVVFDCGSQGRPHMGTWTLVPFLLDRGHREVDLVVLSHADADHINGFVELASALNVHEVWIGDDFGRNAEGAAILGVIRSFCDHIRVVKAGERYRFGEQAELSVVWPDLAWNKAMMSETSESNEGSIVLHLQTSWTSVLLPGDAEDRFVSGQSGRLPHADVLIAPHHGSPFNCVDELVLQTRPRWVIVSSRYGFAPQSMLDRYASSAKLWSTSNEGFFTIREGSASAEE